MSRSRSKWLPVLRGVVAACALSLTACVHPEIPTRPRAESEPAVSQSSSESSITCPKECRLTLVDRQTGAEALFVLYDELSIEEWGRPRSDGMSGLSWRLLAAGWDDGRIVWKPGAAADPGEELSTAVVDRERVRDCARELIRAMVKWEGGHPGGTLCYGGYLVLVATDGTRCIDLASRDRSEPGSPVPEIDPANMRPEFREAAMRFHAYRTSWCEYRARIAALIEASSASSVEAFAPRRLSMVRK